MFPNNIPNHFLLNDNQFLTKIGQIEQIDLLDFRAVNAILITASKEEEVVQILRRIRNQIEQKAFLTPVFAPNDHFSNALLQQFDGVYKPNNDNWIITFSQSINSRIGKLPILKANLNFEQELLLKIFQFLYTREKDIQPYTDRRSKIGYGYTLINSFLPAGDNYKLLQLLDKYVNKGYLQAHKREIINLCPSCLGSYLNFKECCQNCHDINIEAESLIHHFRCAHVSMEKDFNKKNNQLECPKCSRTLRHIGIDYDKPADIYECKSCHHQSQETIIRVKCIDCEHDMELSKLQQLDINSFSLNLAGRKAAIDGFLHILNIEKATQEERTTVNWEMFKFIIQQERERSKLVQSNSSLSFINIEPQLLEPLSADRQEQLSNEFTKIIKSYLRKVDIVACKNANTYAYFMPEVTETEIDKMKQLLSHNLNKLLTDNLQITGTPVEISTYDISADLHGLVTF